MIHEDRRAPNLFVGARHTITQVFPLASWLSLSLQGAPALSAGQGAGGAGEALGGLAQSPEALCVYQPLPVTLGGLLLCCVQSNSHGGGGGGQVTEQVIICGPG